MKRFALLVVAIACSGSPHTTEPPQTNNRASFDAAIDIAAIDAGAAIDAPPRGALVTTLIPPDASTGVRVIVTESDPCGFIMDRFYFTEGSSQIQPQQLPVANEMAEMISCMLKDSGVTKIEVQGHADDKERDPVRISEERAVYIANLLISKGVPAKLLKVVGYGSKLPLDRKRTAAARAKNRRVDFLILERKPED
jgi:outer membrane protein OmpA-like peptidoglycan-associated protein